MKQFKVLINENIEVGEFLKAVNFISEDIIEYHLQGREIVFTVKELADDQLLKEEIEKFKGKFLTQKNDDFIWKYEDINRTYHTDAIIEKSSLHMFADGLIGLNKESIQLFRYFDDVFREIAVDHGAEEKMYPVLLPLDAYQKTGYLKNSPQYAVFCCTAHENIQVLEELNQRVSEQSVKQIIMEPEYALSPAACFHTYLEYQNQVLENNKTFTFQQSVFRNEGRFNFKEMGRLRDYHVREVVFIGSMDYVVELRDRIKLKVIDFVEELQLNGDLSVASDPFVMPKLQKYKKLQQMEKSKYELNLSYSDAQKMSVASFNLHGTAFTHPFNIRVKENENTVTGCVGFGIERWVISFLCQYGTNIVDWPEKIRDKVKGLKL